MKFNSTFFSSLLIFSTSLLSTNANAWAAKKIKPVRWFEVEVILFKQLNNKSALKEQFPDNIDATNLPKYRQSFDLLNHYLQPNLSRIKQFVPLCSEKNAQHPLLNSWQRVSIPFPKKMQLIEQIATLNRPDFSNETKQSENLIVELDLQKEVLAKPLFSTQKICVITQHEIEQLLTKEQLTNFKIDSFSTNSLPTKLNAIGTHISDNAYLIADDSLLLKDITQRLRWSKEFKPLLHFGWRQIGITKRKAIPLKLFAGENLAYKYQQALADYHIKNADKISLQAKNKQTNKSDLLSANDVLKIKTEYKQQALNELFSQFELINSPVDKNTITNIIKDIDKQNLNDILSINDVKIRIDDQQLAISNPPKKPLQPWFLNGFIKVHLDHYLYITADFNVFNQNKVTLQSDVESKSERDEKNKLKLINFSQNRRVITGEVHYFDHPYIGMIVQIRRFDPSKPVGKQVTQAIK